MRKTIVLLMFYLLLSFTTCIRSKESSSKNITDKDFPSEMVNFVAYKDNPVFSGTGKDSWDKNIRERGYILFEEGLYKMWYSGYNHEIAEEKYLGYATSKDGNKWEKYSDHPVFSEKWTEDMFVIKYEGIYYMFAEGKHDIAHLLISEDGINWEEQGNLIILTTKGDTIPPPYGTPTAWIENDKWYLFYERNDMGIWLAQSSDNLTWINILDEPVLNLGPGKYDIAAVAANQVVKFKDKFYMYYHATDRLDWQHPDSHVEWTSNLAMSADLIHWKKYPGNPIVEGDHSSPVLVFDGVKPSLYTMHSEVFRYMAE